MSKLPSPGSGVPLSTFTDAATRLDLAAFRDKYGDGFFLHHGAVGAPAGAYDGLKTASGELVGPGLRDNRDQEFVVFAVRKWDTSPYSMFISIGRDSHHDICLPAPSVSRFHAYVVDEGGVHFLQDASSTHGTLASGRPVSSKGDGEPHRLKPGTVVAFGDAHLTYVSAGELWTLAKKISR